MDSKTTGVSVAALVWCSLQPSPASAFCGFYVSGVEGELVNEASSVVIMRAGDRTVISMANDYRGPPEDFALVVPIPEAIEREQVRTLSRDAFERVERLSSPRLVEYWERDPCPPPRPPSTSGLGLSGYGRGRGRRRRGGAGVGGGLGRGQRPPPVTVEASFAVDEYDVVILGARESAGLETWLRASGYRIPAGAASALRPYVEAGSHFLVARVDVSRLRFEEGRAVLSPLRFHYRSEELSLPVRLGRINADGAQDVIVNILAPETRFEVANRPNVLAPTNLVARERMRGAFGRVYGAVLDRLFEHQPDAVVTEYAWNALTCDPCPTNALGGNDLGVFGADVLTGEGLVSTRASFVLTRLRARVGSEDESDLVFRPAEAIRGGRGRPFRGGGFRRAVDRGGRWNSFQVRYAILHRWTGPMTCESPRRGRWGAPPRGMRPAARPAPRAESSSRPVNLRRYIHSWVAALRRRRD